MSFNDNVHNNAHYFWQSSLQHDKEIQLYYQVAGGYLCPDCKVIEPCFATFKREHGNASPFPSNKKAMARQLYHCQQRLPSSINRRLVSASSTTPEPYPSTFSSSTATRGLASSIIRRPLSTTSVMPMHCVNEASPHPSAITFKFKRALHNCHIAIDAIINDDIASVKEFI